MSRSRSNVRPPQCSHVRPSGTNVSIGRSYQASAFSTSKIDAARSMSAAVSSDWPQPWQTSAGIGTPHDRCREMHQSGRVRNMPVIRSRPQSGIQRTPLASEIAASRSPSMLMNHCDVARKITGE